MTLMSTMQDFPLPISAILRTGEFDKKMLRARHEKGDLTIETVGEPVG